MEAFAASNTVILALADELAAGMIKKTLVKPDLDRTLAKIRPPLVADDKDEESWPWLPGAGPGG